MRSTECRFLCFESPKAKHKEEEMKSTCTNTRAMLSSMYTVISKQRSNHV